MFRIKTALLACLLSVFVFASTANAHSREMGSFGQFVTNSHVGIPPPPGPPGGKAPPISFMWLNSALKDASRVIKAQADLAAKRQSPDLATTFVALNILKDTIHENAQALQKVVSERNDGLQIDIEEWETRVLATKTLAAKGQYFKILPTLEPIKTVVFKVLGLPANAW